MGSDLPSKTAAIGTSASCVPKQFWQAVEAFCQLFHENNTQ
jgi:hypothetical protein